MFVITGAYVEDSRIEVVFQADDGLESSVFFPWKGDGNLWPCATFIGYPGRRIEISAPLGYKFSLEDFFHSGGMRTAMEAGVIGSPQQA